MFGGRKKGGKRGWGAQGKHMVFGIYKRNGQVLTFPIGSRAGDTLIPLITHHTKSGSLYYTDGWWAYTFLPIRGNHVVVEKEKGVPKGRDHLNGIEGFWSYAKHWLYQYRGVPKQYFHLYLKEVEWRFNHRNQKLLPLLRGLLNQSVNVHES
jgi:transposase